MTINILRNEKVTLPTYKTEGSAGADVRARIDTPITIPSFERAVIPTGIYAEIPKGYEIQVRPRSGLALKSGITVLNTPGTIDSDFRGEIKVILYNSTKWDYVVNDGDRIAQLVVAPVVQMKYKFVDEVSSTERGEGGFGSTGIK